MGDPRKLKKKYSKPGHPWQAVRIKDEAVLMKEYSLKNKQELWKASSLVKKFKSKAKEIIAFDSEQAQVEKEQLLGKLSKLNLLSPKSKVGDVLDIPVTTLLERRLQTVVYKKGLARTTKQARQFITHRHITINGKGVNIPSYMVSMEEEPHIAFTTNSKLNNEDHPERKLPEKEEVKLDKKDKEKVVKKAQEEKTKEEVKPKEEKKVETPKVEVKEEKIEIKEKIEDGPK